MPALLAGCAVTVLLSASSALATDKDTRQLEQTRARLAELSARLAADDNALRAARERSFELERLLAATAARQPGFAQRIKEKEAAVGALREKNQHLQAELERARAVLRRNTLARYVIAMQPRMKVLLNQHEAGALSRTMTYYEYAQRAYERDFTALNDKLVAASRSAATLQSESASLRQLHSENEARLAALKKAQGEHRALIAAIEARMADGAVRLRELQHDEQRLLQLLAQLAAKKAAPPAAVRFASLKGKLTLPAAGRVAKAPGAALRKDGARWAGVFIDSPAGTEVKAIAAGEVVFADWFRNLGKLVIIDHGDGFLTLYGNNGDIHREVGDSVRAGDTIATVSAGTGDLPAGVYFELRKRGEPVDPRSWFARR